MEIHRELSDLVSRAGEGVLRDATEFRAAIDDFLGERAATEGELNLLTDAIRLGCLQRLVEQVDHGAAPTAAIDAQAARLAELRGTQETTGARWALTALAFALGRVDEAMVRMAAGAAAADRATQLPRAPKPPPFRPSESTAPSAPAGTVPPVPSTPPPQSTPPVQSTPPPQLRPPPVTSPPTELPATHLRTSGGPVATPVPDVARERGRRPRWPYVASASLLLAGATAGGVVLLGKDADDGDRSDRTPPARSSESFAPVLASGRVVADPDAHPAAPDRRVVIGGRVGGVAVTALGEVGRTGPDDEAMVAAEGDRLIAFTLADGPCEARSCRPWHELALHVVVGSESVPLPSGGPTFVVAAGADAAVELRYDADSYDQRVSLEDGRTTGQNVAVLARARRSAQLARSGIIVPTGVPAITPRPRHVSVGEATLGFFGSGPRLRDPGRAYLTIEVTYTREDRPGETFIFAFDDLNLLDARGKPYRKLDPTPANDKPDVAYVVPADFTRGTLVIGGTSITYDQGVRIQFTVPDTPFPVRIPLE